MATRKITRGDAASIVRNDAQPTASGEQTQDHAPLVKSRPVRRAVAITRDLIAERAQAIWLKRGCPRNRDEENWREAEAQLKIELGLV